MLVDSHCHLDFPGLRRGARGHRRARRGGRRRADGDDLDAGEAVSAKSWRSPKTFDAVYLLGRHASAQCRRGARRHGRRSRAAVRASEGGGDRRGRARLSLRQVAARRAGAELPHPYRRRARAPACRWSSMRATPTTTWRRSWRRKRGRAPSPSSCTAFRPGRALAETGVALGGYVSFSGILTFKNSEELRAIAADVPHDRLLVETDAPYLAPMPLRGKRNEPAFVAHTASGAGRDDRHRRGRDRRNHHGQFLPSFHEDAAPGGRAPERGGSAAPHHSRLRLVAGHAAHHRRLGHLRSRQPEEPAHARRSAGRADLGRRRRDDASSSTPGRIFASRC